MGHLLLFLFSICLLWLFYRDGKERAGVSTAVWIAVGWLVIYGTRPVTDWFSGGALLTSGSRDEGNLPQAVIGLTLMLLGLVVLQRRGVELSQLIRNNVWLFVFYLFWLLSIVWSDYPLITFKRLFKDLGNVVMVLLVLTERDPGDAIKAVCTRLTYLCIPLSVLLYRYFPELGRVYVGYQQDTQQFAGVTTNKNALGTLALVGALFLLWDILDLRGKSRGATRKPSFVARLVVLSMCWYVLMAANSITSLFCALLGSAFLLAFAFPSVRRRPGMLEGCGAGAAVLLFLLDSAFNLKEALLLSVGRDASLTSRADIWPMLMSFQESPLLGAGFDTFWAGHRFRILSEQLGGIIQAHNGYLEIYLNGGSIGVSLLVIVLLSAYWRIRKQLTSGVPESTIRWVVLLIAIIYNYTEASFFKVGLLWFVTIFAFLEYRQKPTYRAISV